MPTVEPWIALCADPRVKEYFPSACDRPQAERELDLTFGTRIEPGHPLRMHVRYRLRA